MNVRIFGVAAAVLLSCATVSPSRADGYPVNSVNDFYEPLGAFGYWVDVAPHGWCWYPARVEEGWRPYANGHWLWSDNGWYWVSEEPWAWATYHYGRWMWHPRYGWLWIPGTEWAPAWVAWREGDGYVGWAPLPPEPVVYVERIVIVPEWFVFVHVRNFCRPIKPHCLIVDKKICDKTVHRRPHRDAIERHTGKAVPVLSTRAPLRLSTGVPTRLSTPRREIEQPPVKSAPPARFAPPVGVKSDDRGVPRNVRAVPVVKERKVAVESERAPRREKPTVVAGGSGAATKQIPPWMMSEARGQRGGRGLDPE